MKYITLTLYALLAAFAFDYHLAAPSRPHRCDCGAYWIDELNTTLTGWRQTG